MPRNYEWQSRIKAVEREHLAMRQAGNYFVRVTRSDPTLLSEGLHHSEVTFALSKLEGTYVIRLFAEFETGARQFWASKWQTVPKTLDVLNGLAARYGIPDAQRENAHKVREYRNSLVHEREDSPEIVPIDKSRNYLCRFFSYLPPTW